MWLVIRAYTNDFIHRWKSVFAWPPAMACKFQLLRAGARFPVFNYALFIFRVFILTWPITLYKFE